MSFLMVHTVQCEEARQQKRPLKPGECEKCDLRNTIKFANEQDKQQYNENAQRIMEAEAGNNRVLIRSNATKEELEAAGASNVTAFGVTYGSVSGNSVYVAWVSDFDMEKVKAISTQVTLQRPYKLNV